MSSKPSALDAQECCLNADCRAWSRAAEPEFLVDTYPTAGSHGSRGVGQVYQEGFLEKGSGEPGRVNNQLPEKKGRRLFWALQGGPKGLLL